MVALLGFKPRNYQLFKTALRHSSVIYTKKLDLESNERLEFLGDAVLDLVISEILYDKYPNKNEGELTKLRVLVVNRNFLNDVSVRIGVPSLLHQYVGKKKDLLKERHNIYGNALEAIIGAIYIDKGLKKAADFVKQIILSGDDFREATKGSDTDYKSGVISWAQKEGKKIEFIDEPSEDPELFKVKVKIGGKYYGEGEGKRKKVAHQTSAKATIELLKENNVWRN